MLMAIRLVYLILGSSVMTLTTTPNNLTDGLEKALDVRLEKLHVPVHEIAMMMSIALRFIPILLDETDKIMKAQMARGADFESGNLIQKAKNMVPLLGAAVCLGIPPCERSGDWRWKQDVMLVAKGRTKMMPLVYHKVDRLAYVVVIAYFVLLMVIKVVL